MTGVGPITVLAYVVTLEDPRRVARSRNVGPYLGLSPKRYQSGTIDRALGITKAGDVFLRRTLVQAAQYILGPFGPDTALRRFGAATPGAAAGARPANARWWRSRASWPCCCTGSGSAASATWSPCAGALTAA